MEYESLTLEEQKSILENRIKQYEMEHFNHVMNLEALKVAEIKPEDKKTNKKFAMDSLATLENAITLHKAKLAALKNRRSISPLIKAPPKAPKAAAKSKK